MTGFDIHSLSIRRALDLIPADARAEWRSNYLTDEGQALRVEAIIERYAKAMQIAGDEVTTRTVLIELADRAGLTKDPDTMWPSPT